MFTQQLKTSEKIVFQAPIAELINIFIFNNTTKKLVKFFPAAFR